jgi:hypothetical protein
MKNLSLRVTAIVVLAVSFGQALAAKDKKKDKADSPQDQIKVEAHIVVAGGPITAFAATTHYNRSYVYAERGPGQPVTLLDVTNPAQPKILSQVTSSSGAVTGNLVAAAGTAALSTSAGAPITQAAQTLRLMDFSDPTNPKVTQQFDGVTAVERLSNGLIMLANTDGVWILSQHLAPDPAEEACYAYKVIYGETQYCPPHP